MRKELTRITPKSVVKVFFFLGLAINFLLGLLWGLFLKGAIDSGSDLFTKGEMPFEPMTWVEVLLGAFLFAVVGSVVYAIAGGIVALLYNLVVQHFGGIEFHVTEESSKTSSEAEHTPRGTP